MPDTTSLGVMSLATDDQFYRALVSRDARFDGVFFVGVTSTGVYCRPVCRAPKPRPENCRFFTSAAAAERRGFRPCLRCRPELAPAASRHPSDHPGPGRTATIDAVGQLARVAAARIAAGALDRAGVQGLAADLGVSARHLRRAVERELGVSPVELAQTHRLLMAKQLLTETSLPVSQVAFASGFRSVRRFNAAFGTRYRLAPTALRRHRDRSGAASGPGDPAPTVTLSLSFRPPFDWGAMLRYLAVRAIPGVEVVEHDRGCYARIMQFGGEHGYVVVRSAAPRAAGGDGLMLSAEVSASLLPVVAEVLARLRRLLDLDTDPGPIVSHLATDPTLADLVAGRPGLRVPGAVDGFELAVRAVLGQQVSVRGATTLSGRLVRLIAERLPSTPASGSGSSPASLTHLPISAERLADASPALVASIGLPSARAVCLVALARAVADGQLPELVDVASTTAPADCVRRLQALPGVGPWTATYIAMRALRWPDAFPHGDLALRRAMGGMAPARLRAAADRWRPWRAYAALHLWTSIADASTAVRR